MKIVNKAHYETALTSVSELRHTQAGIAWETLLETRVEALKEELVTAKAERVPEIQGAVREMRRLVDTVRKYGG